MPDGFHITPFWAFPSFQQDVPEPSTDCDGFQFSFRPFQALIDDVERLIIAADETVFSFQRGEFFGLPRVQTILGGDTAVTLTSASTLASLGVSVKGLGSAVIRTGGQDPVADFRITGGSVGPGADALIVHNGSGLELSDKAGRIDARDFLIDTKNHVVDANVSVNGKSAGNVALFDIGADGRTLTLTSAAAGVVDQALGTTAITSHTVIGTAAPSPAINPFTLNQSQLRAVFDPPAGGPRIVIGGDTSVTLTSAPVLSSLGVGVSALGSARLDTDGAAPIADFGITGGTEGPGNRTVLLHQGSGLELKDTHGTLDLRDFIVDIRNDIISANVTVNGASAGRLAVFDIGKDGSSLTLTGAAAGAANATLGLTALNSSVVIGTASTHPFTL